jgi:hypothetical protein
VEPVQRLRDRRYLAHVAQQECLVCRSHPVQAHHLTHVQPKARGLKAGDQWCVPLCFTHHDELHRHGDEGRWWALQGIDPVEWAEREWKSWLTEKQ